jgi:hypothetical protein
VAGADRRRALPPILPDGDRKKKLLIAVNVAADPKWAPCETCNCWNGDAGIERWQLGEKWKSRFCPRLQITQESRDLLRIHAHYREGNLLLAGGMLDQPAIYFSAMEHIDSLIREATATDG